jgi:type IV pilus assembly protein PilV
MLTIKQQHGVSLIESIIALLVISIGLLGIAAMQVTAMKQNASALHHSKAVWAAYDMADRIRANFGQFDIYDGIDTTTAYNQNCTTGVCTAAEMTVSDAQEWSSIVADLPSGRGTITNPNANEILIRVMWDDEGNGATGITCGGATSDLTCYEMTLIQ